MPKTPAKTKSALVQGAFSALAHPERLAMMELLAHAGSTGLRSSEIARKLKLKSDVTRKQLQVLERALFVINHVGKDSSGVYSRYTITEFGDDWMQSLPKEARNLQLTR